MNVSRTVSSVSTYPERTNEIARAVHLLRQHGVVVSFPMQTANGELIFAVGKDLTLTAEQILGLLERDELHAEGVRKLVEAAEKQSRTPMRRQAESL